MAKAFRSARIDDLDRVAVAGTLWRPIRRTLGVTGFGVNAQLTSVNSTGQLGISNSGTTTGGLVAINAGIGGTTIVNNGTMNATSIGIFAQNTNTGATALVGVTGSGNVTTTGSDGIFAHNAGSGATSVNYTGTITAVGGDGVDAASTVGPLTVTTNAVSATGGNGILAASTTGNQIITLNGAGTSNLTGLTSSATTGTHTGNGNRNCTPAGPGPLARGTPVRAGASPEPGRSGPEPRPAGTSLASRRPG